MGIFDIFKKKEQAPVKKEVKPEEKAALKSTTGTKKTTGTKTTSGTKKTNSKK